MDALSPSMRSGLDLPALYLPPEVNARGEEVGTGPRLSVIYTRFSTQNQTEESTERQVDVCSRYEQRTGLANVGRYCDEAVSGTTTETEREQLDRLLADAEDGRFTDVVVESLDRMARKLGVAVRIFERLLDLGIAIHDVEEGRVLNIYDIGVKGAAAQAARDLLVKRAQSGVRRAAARGTFGIANCFGYERVWDEKEHALVWRKKEDEEKIIREIFQLFASGISAQRIADLLNERPPSERGHRFWTRGSLVGNRKFGTGILRRLRYIGVRVHGRVKLTKRKDGIYVVDVHPVHLWVTGNLNPELVIVEIELFDRVQLKLNERAEAAAAKIAAYPRYYSAKKSPLSGLVRCIHCGSTMTPTQKRRDGEPRYLCNKARNKSGCTHSRSFKVEPVEDEVHRLLLEHVAPETAILHYVEIYNSEAQDRIDQADENKEALERERRRLISEMDRNREDEEQERYPRSYLEEKRVKLGAEYAQVEKRLAELAALSRAVPVRIDPAERVKAHRKLMASLASVFTRGFDATSQSGTEVVAALRRLIYSVVLDIEADACTLLLKCRMVTPDDNSDRNIVTFESRIERTPHVWEASKREVRRIADVVESGVHAVTDEEWRQIAYLVPDSVGMSKRGNGVDKRSVVDAALLHLWEGVPLKQMPERFGPKEAVFAALKRLSESGGWDVVADELHRIAPERIPDVKSAMFSTDRSKPSSALKGLPRVRAERGVAAATGKHAPSDELWSKVKHLIPEQVLQVNQQSAYITPRRFLHGLLYWLCEKIPMSHLPLMFGSYNLFNHAIGRLAGHGHLDQLIQELQAISPSLLKDANLKLLDRFPRSKKEVPIWRRALPKQSDLDGVPDHSPDERTWTLVEHLFPSEILVFKDETVIRSPRIFAHAVLYRIKEKIPCSKMPPYFGNPDHVQRCLNVWVFQNLWNEFCRVLLENAPDVLKGADLSAFDQYKRGRGYKYRYLINAERQPPPAHQPTEEDFALFEELIPIEVLGIRGRPAIMEPRKFFHAIVYMLKEHTLFGGLPLYFGKTNDVRTAARRFIAHHLWATMRARIEHLQPEWAEGVDLTIFDTYKVSKNPDPEFRKHRVRDAKKGGVAIAAEGNGLPIRP